MLQCFYLHFFIRAIRRLKNFLHAYRSSRLSQAKNPTLYVFFFEISAKTFVAQWYTVKIQFLWCNVSTVMHKNILMSKFNFLVQYVWEMCCIVRAYVLQRRAVQRFSALVRWNGWRNLLFCFLIFFDLWNNLSPVLV